MEQTSHRAKILLAGFGATLLAVIAGGLVWFFTTTLNVQNGLEAAGSTIGLGWYVFSFAAGLTMIVLPCTLPLAFVIVPLSIGGAGGNDPRKGPVKGLGVAICFGLGVAITLSLYGIAAAMIGKIAIGTLGAPLEVVKNWLYFVAGTLAYLFALGELGLINIRMPTYTGAAPAFIQKQQDYIKALALGLFLGNVGVGCPHPATPFILGRIAVSGSIFYGWLLFFVHAIGRVLPLLFLAILAVLGVNGLSWLVARKDKIERATGWGMVFVAAFILVLGLFSHAWWVYSGQHTLLEEFTKEEYFLGKIINQFHLAGIPHSHGTAELVGQTGLFGLPLWLGDWALIMLWIFPIWWYYNKKKQESWRFWFSVVFTLLLVVTFGWYLPMRFQYNAMTMPHMHQTVAYEAADVRSGPDVDLTVSPLPAMAGSSTQLSFFVNHKPDGTPLPASQLQYEHTKLMHVIGVRDDMSEFFHIHPYPNVPAGSTPESGAIYAENTDGIFTARYAFAKPGRYKIWAEITKDNLTYIFGERDFAVEGLGDRGGAVAPVFLDTAAIGNDAVTFTHDPIIGKNREARLAFTIRDQSGRLVPLEPYLGADMHLNIIKSDWSVSIHTHPSTMNMMMFNDFKTPSLISVAQAHDANMMSGQGFGQADQNGIPFRVALPSAGIYKAFAQFRPAGSTLPLDQPIVASFWLKVEESASPSTLPAAPPPKAALIVVSLVGIFLLSWGVKRFLDIKDYNE